MHNYAETCKDISSYISMYNFFIYLLPLKSYIFVTGFSRAFYMKTTLSPKALLYMECSSPCLLSFERKVNTKFFVSEKLTCIL